MERVARHHEPLPRIEAPRSAKHSKALPQHRRASWQRGRCSSISPQAPGDSSRLARQTIQKRFPATTSYLRCRRGEDLSNRKTRRETTHPQAMQPPPRTRTSTTRDIRRKASTRIEPTAGKRDGARYTTRRQASWRRNARQCEQQHEPWHKREHSSAGASTVAEDEKHARNRSRNGRDRLLREAQCHGTPLWISREENGKKA